MNTDFPSHPILILGAPLLALFSYYRLFKTPRGKMFFLLASSVLFYSLVAWKFLPLLAGLSLATYWAGRKSWFAPGVILNLGAWLFSGSGLPRRQNAPKVLSVAIPLGISFFILKHVGYLLDVRAKRYAPSADAWTFLCFSAYFPQISAGPISSYGDTAGQFSTLPERLEKRQERRPELIYALFMGLAKKVLIADPIGSLRSAAIPPGGLSGLIPAWYLLTADFFQIYFDFSGYTDMALGISALFGVRLPPNFNSPLLASDPREFWERWHISLSTWFRFYVFFPLSRSLLKKWGSLLREPTWRYMASSTCAVMLLVGLWHGWQLGYLVWGAYFGLLLNLNAWWKRTGRQLPGWVSRPALFLSLLFGIAFFTRPRGSMPNIVGRLVGSHGLGTLAVVKSLLHNDATSSLLVAIALSLTGLGEAAQVINSGRGQAKWQLAIWGVLGALSILLIRARINFFYVRF